MSIYTVTLLDANDVVIASAEYSDNGLARSCARYFITNADLRARGAHRVEIVNGQGEQIFEMVRA